MRFERHSLLALKPDGWEVCGQVQNGREGLAKAAELRPDLIILDLVMPVMDGLQTAREIAKILPDAPILLHTQHYSPEIVLEAKKFGVRQVLAKTGPAETLFQALESLASTRTTIPGQDSAVATALTAATIAENATIDTTKPEKPSPTIERAPTSEPPINSTEN
jgi:NarL family two-component system response regulator LiaR